MVTFVRGFYAKFPHFKNRELFITGESYGGHYVTSITAYLLAQNIPYVNIQGMAIGNGLFSAIEQWP